MQTHTLLGGNSAFQILLQIFPFFASVLEATGPDIEASRPIYTLLTIAVLS
jgi:hypothetical protein